MPFDNAQNLDVTNFYKKHLYRYFRALRYPLCSLTSLRVAKIPGHSDRRHLFIVGIPRSGTSLISAILRQHPAFSSAGAESHFMAIRNFCYMNLPGMDRRTLRSIIGMARSRAEIFDLIADFYLEAKPGSYCFFDKSPEHASHAAELVRMFPNSKFCFMIRNPLDAYSSLKGINVRNYTLEEFASYWMATCYSIDSIPKENRIVIKYEELCYEIENTFIKLASFLNIEHRELVLAAACRSMEPGNFDESTGHSRIAMKIDGSTIGQWRKKLSSCERERLLAIVLDGVDKFGYSRVLASK